MTTTTVSEVSICNLALSWLGGQSIIALTDNTVEGKLCLANYPLSRDAVLEVREWSFALKRASPAAAVLTQAELDMHSGYQPFVMPSDVLRITRASTDVNYHLAHDVDWYLEGGFIWADATVIYIKYLWRLEDPLKFSPTFVHAVAAFMASNMAIPIAGSKELQKIMAALYRVKLETAGAYDGMQGKNQALQSTQLTRVR